VRTESISYPSINPNLARTTPAQRRPRRVDCSLSCPPIDQRRTPWIIVALAASLALLGLIGCGASSVKTPGVDAPAPKPSATVRLDDQLAQCRAADVGLSLSKPISPMTGEHVRYFVLTNDSSKSCVLGGYPRVALYERSRPLPFVYKYGSGYYISASRPSHLKPSHVVLRARSTAAFVLAKYRCDTGISGQASELRLSLPGSSTALHIALPPEGGGAGVSELAYCRALPHDKSRDPGNTVEVSAIFQGQS
jgi:Protein of unknown function (DUF4232)